jgi:hypothetical protein
LLVFDDKISLAIVPIGIDNAMEYEDCSTVTLLNK